MKFSLEWLGYCTTVQENPSKVAGDMVDHNAAWNKLIKAIENAGLKYVIDVDSIPGVHTIKVSNGDVYRTDRPL